MWIARFAAAISPIFSWLSENIWSKGSLFSTDELVKQATGETLNPEHFKAHLSQRYLKYFSRTPRNVGSLFLKISRLHRHFSAHAR